MVKSCFLTGFCPKSERIVDMKRPNLNQISLNPAHVGIPMQEGEEWSSELQTAYDAGHRLTEFNESELPVRAFCKRPEVDR